MRWSVAFFLPVGIFAYLLISRPVRGGGGAGGYVTGEAVTSRKVPDFIGDHRPLTFTPRNK